MNILNGMVCLFVQIKVIKMKEKKEKFCFTILHQEIVKDAWYELMPKMLAHLVEADAKTDYFWEKFRAEIFHQIVVREREGFFNE